MFNFKRKTKQVLQSFRNLNDVVKEIHEAFDTASEKLLKDAKEILAGSYDIEKGERLKKLGFSSAKKAVEAEENIKTKEENAKLAKSIEYYQTHYPNNKFITEDMVEKICKKYGLICAGSSRYIGDIPEKNLSEIEEFSLREEDMKNDPCNWYTYSMIDNSHRLLRCHKNDPGAQYGYIAPSAWNLTIIPVDESVKFHYSKEDFKICASVKDFNTQYMEISNGYNLVTKDPIVLQPVNNGYLIVTKWGLEGDDEELTNEKMN